MVKVAIAGGSGGLGRVITDAIVATRKHEVFVLSRNVSTVNWHHGEWHALIQVETEQNKSPFSDGTQLKYLEIDYSSIAGIAEMLRANEIEVVISAIGILFEDTYRAQMNLIDGASQSGTVKRFAPSEFAIDYVEAKKK